MAIKTIGIKKKIGWCQPRFKPSIYLFLISVARAWA